MLGAGAVPPNFILFFSPEFFEDIFGKERSKEIGPSRFFFCFFFQFLVFLGGFVVQRPFSDSHPAGSDRTGLYSVPRLSRVGSQVYRSAHLLEGGRPGSDADIGGRGEQPPPGAAWLSRSVNPKVADRKLVLRN